MINIETVKSAIEVTQELDKRGLYLTPLNNTPLERLSQLSCVKEVITPTPNQDYVPDEGYITNMSSSMEHSEELDDISEELSKVVERHLLFCKDIVKPVIVEVSEKVASRFTQIDKEKQYDITIVQQDLPDPLYVSSLEEEVKKYKGSERFVFTNYVSCVNEYSTPEIIDLLMTGQDDVDDAIKVWVAKKGESFFKSVFEDCFSFNQVQNSLDSSVDYSLATFLFCTKLYNSPIDGFKLNLTDYNDKISDLRKAAAIKLIHSYDKQDINNKTGLLILDNNSKEVFVNAVVYKQFIDQGGNNAAIFGSVLSAQQKRFIKDIIADQSNLTSVWERHNNVYNTTLRSQSLLMKKDALRTTLLSHVETNFNDLYSHLCSEGVCPTQDLHEYSEFKQRLDTFVDNLKDTDLVNIWTLCTNSVCSCLFYYTSAGQILNGVELASAQTPGIDLREALLLSTIEYVTDYVCEQIRVYN